MAERAMALTEAGVDEDLALRVAASDIAAAALDIAEVSGTCGRSLAPWRRSTSRWTPN
jgi:glutamate dehydrogenase